MKSMRTQTAKHLKRSLSACAAASISIASLSGVAHAQPLKNFIQDLYGGNGIFLSVAPGAFNHSAHFASESLTELSNLNRAVVSNLGLSSLTPSTSVYNFNLSQGMPTENTISLGPIFGERAETIGAGKISVAASFTHQNFTTYNGQSLSDIVVLTQHQPVPGCSLANCSFLEDQVRLDVNLNLSRNVYTVYSEYGVTDRWDVGIILPIVQQTARANSTASILNFSGTNVHRFDAQHPSVSSTGGTASGLGDVILRTKYNFLRDYGIYPDVSVVGQVNLPTGDQSNLLGSGSTDVLVGLVLSKQIGRIAPHLDIGYQWAAGGFDRNNLLYAVGADVGIVSNFTVAADFVGRWYNGAGSNLNTTDFSIGAKWRPFDQTVFIADVLVPVNKGSGLRSPYIAVFGTQITF